jgi:hypothetical protein
MARKPGPQPVGTKPYQLKIFARDEAFIVREAIRRGMTEAALVRELLHLGITVRGSELKATYSLTTAMREAQEKGMKKVFAAVGEGLRQDLARAIEAALAQQHQDLLKGFTQALAEQSAQLQKAGPVSEPGAKKLSETLAAQNKLLEKIQQRVGRIYYLVNVILSFLVDLFAAQFSLFKINAFKSLSEDPAQAQAFAETQTSVNAAREAIEERVRQQLVAEEKTRP